MVGSKGGSTVTKYATPASIPAASSSGAAGAAHADDGMAGRNRAQVELLLRSAAASPAAASPKDKVKPDPLKEALADADARATRLVTNIQAKKLNETADALSGTPYATDAAFQKAFKAKWPEATKELEAVIKSKFQKAHAQGYLLSMVKYGQPTPVDEVMNSLGLVTDAGSPAGADVVRIVETAPKRLGGFGLSWTTFWDAIEGALAEKMTGDRDKKRLKRLEAFDALQRGEAVAKAAEGKHKAAHTELHQLEHGAHGAQGGAHAAPAGHAGAHAATPAPTTPTHAATPAAATPTHAVTPAPATPTAHAPELHAATPASAHGSVPATPVASHAHAAPAKSSPAAADDEDVQMPTFHEDDSAPAPHAGHDAHAHAPPAPAPIDLGPQLAEMNGFVQQMMDVNTFATVEYRTAAGAYKASLVKLSSDAVDAYRKHGDVCASAEGPYKLTKGALRQKVAEKSKAILATALPAAKNALIGLKQRQVAAIQLNVDDAQTSLRPLKIQRLVKLVLSLPHTELRAFAPDALREITDWITENKADTALRQQAAQDSAYVAAVNRKFDKPRDQAPSARRWSPRSAPSPPSRSTRRTCTRST